MLSYSSNIVLSFDLYIVKLVKKPTGRSHPVEDAACPVKWGSRQKRGIRTNSADQFLGDRGSNEECKPFPAPFLLSLLWSKDILTYILTFLLHRLGLRLWEGFKSKRN